MAEKKIEWTEQQKRAIVTRGSDVLVTASAGTGKTAVLSGRCVDIVRDKSICPDVWSILVVTFTDMAAEQMRSRIAEQLRAAFEKSGDRHIRYQLMLLQGADISTIHSFCKRLITEYFYQLGLDPIFRIIDSDEQKLLEAEVLEKTIDWAWEQSNLRAALEQFFYRRDLRTNDGFLSKIIELNDFLDGVVSRQNWYERAVVLAEATNPLITDLGKRQKQIIAEKLQQILSRLQHAQNIYKNEGGDGSWASLGSAQTSWAEKLEESHIKPVANCLGLLNAGDWNKCADAIRNFAKPKTSTPRELPESVAKLLHDTAKDAIDAFKDLSQFAIVNPDYLDRISGSSSLQTKVLVELVKKFDQLYSQAKRMVNCMDFADLEHYALKLLTEDINAEDELSPSQTALALRRKYKYIFVDEYQDINPVQQAILKMLGSEGNVFVVGDVKQSIYAWRGAEPKIFIKDLKSASVDPKNAPEGLRVDLNANFRSAKGILDFVNKIFSRIMTASFGDVDYDESAQLKPAQVTGQQSQGTGNVVEFHILDEKSINSGAESQQEGELRDENPNPVRNSRGISNGVNIIGSRQRQAAMIARRIRGMVGADTGRAEFQIYDKQKGCLRDVQYRDIVILMRSLAKKANDYVEVLRLAGVPVSCQATAGYFEATEITDCLCLLKVLDNPQRDIELAALLRGPFFKISDTELAKIKLHSAANEQNKNFYACVVQYCESGPDVKLTGRLKAVLAQIEDWRTAARRENLADLIWRIYRQTGFLSFVSALPNGQARRANLLKLHDRAIQFAGFATSVGIASLTRFVEFIEKLQEAGQDWSPAEPPESAGNAVRIISIHKSKGLEFPVVFLAELESKFNKKDTFADYLADANYTLGLQIIDRRTNSKLRSPAYEVIAEEKLSTSLAEEMRILYVAATRARDRLVLTALQKQTSCGKVLSKGLFFGGQPCQRRHVSAGEPIPGWVLADCQSPLEWILYGLCDQKSLHNAFETHLIGQAIDDKLFSLKVYRGAELEQFSKYVQTLRSNKLSQRVSTIKKSGVKRKESKLLSQIKKSLSWRYKHGDAVVLPAKQSVTGLTHRNDEYVKIGYSRALEQKPRAVMAAEAELTEPQGRLIGTATHLVISQLDLTKPISREAIEKTKEKLLADGAITEAVAEHIETESIMKFFESDLGKTALSTWPNVWREWPFTFALPASYVARDPSLVARVAEDETIVVQGIIDMLVQTPQVLIIIDFKTDNVTAAEVTERAELYRRQMELYAKAASAILKSKILSKWLYFLTPGLAIKV